MLPWLGDNALASFLLYFVLYDFAAYWLHRAQHAFSWWWALHSLHHSQRRMTVWTDDRNHVIDDLLVTLALVVFSQIVGVQPGEYVVILMVGRLVESWSHANVDMGFGWLGDRLLVGPRFHRLHHALASPDERHIHDHNFAPVFPIWDILFGTAIYDGRNRPTGVDDPVVDADNGRGWIVQQVTVFWRFARALMPRPQARDSALSTSALPRHGRHGAIARRRESRRDIGVACRRLRIVAGQQPREKGAVERISGAGRIDRLDLVRRDAGALAGRGDQRTFGAHLEGHQRRAELEIVVGDGIGLLQAGELLGVVEAGQRHVAPGDGGVDHLARHVEFPQPQAQVGVVGDLHAGLAGGGDRRIAGLPGTLADRLADRREMKKLAPAM